MFVDEKFEPGLCKRQSIWGEEFRIAVSPINWTIHEGGVFRIWTFSLPFVQYLEDVWIQNQLLLSTCAAFVRCLGNSLESELGGVFHLCNIRGRFGGQLAWGQADFHGAFMVVAFVADGRIRVRIHFSTIALCLRSCSETFLAGLGDMCPIIPPVSVSFKKGHHLS